MQSFNQVIRKYNILKHENDVFVGKVEMLKKSLIMIGNGRNKNEEEKIRI